MAALPIAAQSGFVVIESAKILLRPLPKSSSTFLKRIAIWSEGRIPPVTAVPGEVRPALAVHRSDLNQLVSLSTASEQVVEQALHGDDWLRLLVVRHPVERLLSFWHDKLHLMDPAYGALFQGIRESKGKLNSAALGVRFSDWVEYLFERWDLLHQDVHLTPQAELACVDQVAYSHVIKREQLSKDLMPLWLERLTPAHQQLLLKEMDQYESLYRQRLAKRWPEVASQEVLRAVSEMYQKDFEAFDFALPQRSSSRVKGLSRYEPDAVVDPLQQIRDRNAQIAELQRDLQKYMLLAKDQRLQRDSGFGEQLQPRIDPHWPQHAAPGSPYASLYARLLAGFDDSLAAEILQLDINPEADGEAVYLCGLVCQMRGQFTEALERYARASNMGFTTPYVLFNSANSLRGLKRHEEAFVAYRQALAMMPDFPECELNMANTHLEINQTEPALEILQALVRRRPDYSHGAFVFGNCLRDLGRLKEAINAYHLCLEYNRESCDALNNQGLAYGAIGELNKARDSYLLALTIDPAFRPARQNYAQWLIQAKRHEEALELFQGLASDAGVSTERVAAYQGQVACLLELSRYDEALALADSEPIEWLRLIKRLHVLPVLYQTNDEIVAVRQRFSGDLSRLSEGLAVEALSEDLYQEIYEHAWALTNFYLAYQMENDRPLQEQYAQLLVRILTPRLGAFMQPLAVEAFRSNQAFRIGVISPHLKNHNGSIWALGWLNQLIGNPDYELFSYNLGEEQDAGTQQFREISNYRHLPVKPDTAEQVFGRIREDHLDLLIFTDIGMHPASKIASVLRLAHVQCQGWGHPVTSGSPQMDYFIGSDGMEHDDSNGHYSEQLVRLPNTGLYYQRPAVVHDGQSLFEKFSLDRDRPLLLSMQSTFKYIPANDGLFAEIAVAHPQACMVFVGHMGHGSILGAFRARLAQVFERYGLQLDQHACFLPRLDYADYMGMFSIAHHTLDTVDWNGGNSSFQSLSLGCPVVTLPTRFMRGRHTVAMLRQLEVEELIAADAAEYVAISSRLLSDRKFYKAIRDRINSRQHLLFNDQAVAIAFKDWLDQLNPSPHHN